MGVALIPRIRKIYFQYEMEQPITAACKRTEVVIPDHQVRCVVVYPDRAEVTREVRLQLDAGENEVVLKSLSKALDKLE